ncbi:MAG TPA: 50S ribosomal protein L35 [Acidimicrobiales bacterium]|jgi:large subunit ribosomal protein L35|nr:50S ribosomal protein L35 [Acidimicrobiales bacterium]|tara:strand:+ start:2639 stop:2833 length:195 start_codon:yes stop_codon:yes gene_type:complete
MPKMKTHKSSAKRFKKTASGKLKRGRMHRNHLAEAKSPKRKRQARGPAEVSAADAKTVRKNLGI